MTDWWSPPKYGGIPTQGGGRVTSWVTNTINAYYHCTGCDQTVLVTSHTEADPTHLQAEILASQTGAGHHAAAHSKTCTAKPKETQ